MLACSRWGLEPGGTWALFWPVEVLRLALSTDRKVLSCALQQLEEEEEEGSERAAWGLKQTEGPR